MSYQGRNSIDLETEIFFNSLCSTPGYDISCSKCMQPFGTMYPMESLSFKLLIGLLDCLLTATLNRNVCVNLSECYTMCDGKTSVSVMYIDPLFKTTVDKYFCKSMIVDWQSRNVVNKFTLSKIKTVLQVLDNSTNTQGIVLSFKILYQNYDMWRVEV